jgi:hypothetical protein
MLIRGTSDIGEQYLHRYSQVLCVLNSITQSITIPVILKLKKKFSRKHNTNAMYTAHSITRREI